MRMGRAVSAFYMAARVTSDGCMGSVFADAFGRVREFATVDSLRAAVVAAGCDPVEWELWEQRNTSGWEWRRVGSLAGDPS